MTERPILFNAEMVAAVLDGRKTQTRRPFKPQGGRLWEYSHDLRVPMYQGDGRYEMFPAPCPYGAAGDKLWVRERARVVGDALTDEGKVVRLRYEADLAQSDWMPYPARLRPLKPGRCVPNGCFREASRITLEVTGVRVERVQDITEEDARAEGAVCSVHGPVNHVDGAACPGFRAGFIRLWSSAYGDGAWSRNDWVWVVEFLVVTP